MIQHESTAETQYLDQVRIPTGIVEAALKVGFFVTLGVGGVGLLPLFIWYRWYELAWIVWTFGSIAAGALIAAWFGLRVVVHAWIPPAELAMVDPEESDITPLNPVMTPAVRLLLVVRLILEMHYISGSQATRPECERAGINQVEWNASNTILKQLGIKAERSWIEPSYDQAIYKLREQLLELDAGGFAWIKTDTNGQRKVKVL